MKPTIRNKLVAGFCGVLVLMAAVASIGSFAVFSLKKGAYDAIQVGAQLNASALEIQLHNVEADRRITKYLTQVKELGAEKANGSLLEDAKFEIHEIESLVDKAVAIAATPEIKRKFEKISETSKAYERAVSQAVEMGKKGEDGRAAAGQYEEAAEALHESAEDGELAGRDASHASLEAIERISSRSVSSVVGISLLGMVLGIAVSYKLTRAILVPVEHLKDVAENVSLGNLDMAVRRYSEDEIGDLAESFSRMVTAVKYFRMEAEMTQLETEQEGGQK